MPRRAGETETDWASAVNAILKNAPTALPQGSLGAHKTGELALRQSDERFRTFARLVQGYVFEAALRPDFDVEFTWADDAFAGLFGCERAEVNRRGWHTFVDPRDRAAAAKCLAAIAAGSNAHIELRIESATGNRRWLRMAGEPVRDLVTGSVTGLIGMAEDITDRKVLMEQMFASVNREQRRIGNDLHDELGQVLTGASLLLRGCHTSALRGEAVAPGEIDRVLELLAGAIENTRSLAHGLAPGALDCGGLTSALENLAHQARRWSGLDIVLSSSPGDLGTLDASTSDHLYRMVQEAITNVARHAHARRAEISTRVEDGALIIEVSDDGIGIPASVTNGFGLRTMRYRADAIGAEFAIAATRPHGTRLCVRLPLVAAAAAAAGAT
jgi:PAS domain S-box-containing protein